MEVRAHRLPRNNLDVLPHLLKQGIERLRREPALPADFGMVLLDLDVDIPRSDYVVRGCSECRSNGAVLSECRDDNVRIDDEPDSRRVNVSDVATPWCLVLVPLIVR